MVRLIKLWLSETYSKVQVGKHLSNTFPVRNGLKQWDSLSLLLLNFALEYAIRRFQENQDGLKLSGTHKRLVDAEDVNILGGSVHAVKKNTEALLVGSEEIGLQVNADKTKYMVMSWDQNLGRSHNILTDKSSFEKVEEFRYLGTTLTNQIIFRKK